MLADLKNRIIKDLLRYITLYINIYLYDIYIFYGPFYTFGWHLDLVDLRCSNAYVENH